MPRLIAISCVKNEGDIVEAFVRHTSACVDEMIVLDNGSDDDTRLILQRLADEGMPLSIADDPSPGHYQWRRMTALMKDALERRADWIVPLDGDEFLAGAPLASVLATAGIDRTVALSWKSYVPHLADAADEANPVRRMVHRLKNENTLVKIIIPASLALGADVVLAQGNHQLLINGAPIAPVLRNECCLAHFPGRSPDQFAAKVVEKRVQYLAMMHRDPDWGVHYQAPVAQLRDDPQRFEAKYWDLSLGRSSFDGDWAPPEIVRDPLAYLGGELKYTARSRGKRLLPTLLRRAEDFARRYADACLEQQTWEARLEQRERQLQALRLLHEGLGRDHHSLREELQALGFAQADLQRAYRSLQLEHEAMRQSWAWSVGRHLTEPWRWLKRHLRSPRRQARR
jgi:glycosyltransferase involved in cell wall biosynthesis